MFRHPLPSTWWDERLKLGKATGDHVRDCVLVLRTQGTEVLANASHRDTSDWNVGLRGHHGNLMNEVPGGVFSTAAAVTGIFEYNGVRGVPVDEDGNVSQDSFWLFHLHIAYAPIDKKVITFEHGPAEAVPARIDREDALIRG